MIFIYPASVSENCDKRIVPAICKSIERFFLIQIQDAIVSGEITFYRQWDGHRYGPLLMESLDNYNTKQKLLVEAHGYDYETNSREAEEHEWKRDEDERRRIKHRWDEEKHEMSKQKNQREWDANSREQEKHEWDRQKNQRDAVEHQYKTRKYDQEYHTKHADHVRDYHTPSGNYIPMDSKIDIIPTGSTVETSIVLRGGDNNNRLQNYCNVNINVKVMPTIIKNFKILERDLLNDYFSRKSEAFFKTVGRNVARKTYNVLKRLPFNMGDVIWKTGMEIAGEEIDTESKKDIIYNTHGFVNASAFHKSSSSAGNYNFTSNIVIFNKDDLTNPEDQNIFANRSAMQKLFKLGWSTFCMLDPVEEIMYFISSLDGGYLHAVPYRYLMESYGSRAYYGTETKLRDSAKPFLIKRGNFATFSKLFKKK